MFSDAPLLTDLDFHYVRQLAKASAAIVIDEDKRYLVETRLAPLAQQEGFASLTALIRALRAEDARSTLHVRTIDALTTNETLFFRDRHPFEALATSVLPRLIEARKGGRKLRIWSAAASTGQEAYSVAMLVREHLPQVLGWDLKIIGTDLSETVLTRAREGVYGQHEVDRGLTPNLLSKHFVQPTVGRWQIKPELRSMVEFLQMNLIASWPQLPVFDLVLIRNVLIYFDLETKRKILARVSQQLADDGVLVLGSAETTMLVTQTLEPITVDRSVFFQKARSKP